MQLFRNIIDSRNNNQDRISSFGQHKIFFLTLKDGILPTYTILSKSFHKGGLDSSPKGSSVSFDFAKFASFSL